MIQSFIGLECPQPKHCVTANCSPQCGQAAAVSKVSNRVRHLPQPQNEPCGGASPHCGQTKPSRRGACAIRPRGGASINPPQTLRRVKTATEPSQNEWAR